MKENRIMLKRLSFDKIKDGKNRILMVTAVFLLLSYLITLLVYKLTGLGDYITEYYTMIQDVIMKNAEPYDVVYHRVKTAAYILAAALMILSVILSVGYEGYCLSMSRGKKAGVKSIFDGFSFFSKAFLIVLIREFLMLLGFALFIVPGFMVMYAYSMSIFIMFDNPDKSAIACLRESRQLAYGKKGELFMLDLSLLGWVFLDAIVSEILLPIVQVFLEPYRGIIRAGYYNQYIGYVPTEDTSDGAEKE